jgi:hypothetical protein
MAGRQDLIGACKLSGMGNDDDSLLSLLRILGLDVDEAEIYLQLLKGPTSHLQLARATGVNRTKVYRLADQLESRSLITKRIDDRGMALVAADPAALEVELVEREEELRRKRAAFQSLLPQLKHIQTAGTDFVVNTYTGENGFMQMLWNELKTEGELLSFGGCHLGELVGNSRWAERYRDKVASAGYNMRELVNRDVAFDGFTQNKTYLKQYTCRCIPSEVIKLENVIAIYGDTVATYRWNNKKRVGVEVVNASHAHAMRQIFEIYWNLAGHDSP